MCLRQKRGIVSESRLALDELLEVVRERDEIDVLHGIRSGGAVEGFESEDVELLALLLGAFGQVSGVLADREDVLETRHGGQSNGSLGIGKGNKQKRYHDLIVLGLFLACSLDLCLQEGIGMTQSSQAGSRSVRGRRVGPDRSEEGQSRVADLDKHDLQQEPGQRSG